MRHRGLVCIQNTRGFTIMELMVVVIIIAIGAAIAAPSIGGWLAKQRLNSSARTLASHFQQARMAALKGNEDVRVCFDDNAAPTPDRYIVEADLTDPIVPWTTLEDDTDITPNFAGVGAMAANSTGFDSRGLALQQGSIVVQSTKAPLADNTRTITLSLGGSISIR
ncbi:MAG: GspH/FimT family pseudopilin [Thermodesulfobacteriota bacterium]|nr:GspH/FimT family pseudopilin [Thermodesulfobacteriota bacterium]